MDPLAHHAADVLDVEPALGRGRGVIDGQAAHVAVLARGLQAQELRVEARQLAHRSPPSEGNRSTQFPAYGAPHTTQRERVHSSAMTNAAAQTFDAEAGDYDAARRRLVPPFDAFYGGAVAALELAGRPLRRVLDLGAGTGILARRVAAAHPGAELTLLDGAPAMLEEAAAVLGDRAHYVAADLDGPLPPGPRDAAVSARWPGCARPGSPTPTASSSTIASPCSWPAGPEASAR